MPRQLVSGETGIEWDDDCTELPRCEHALQVLGRILGVDGDAITAAHPQLGESVAQGVDTSQALAVAATLAEEHESSVIRVVDPGVCNQVADVHETLSFLAAVPRYDQPHTTRRRREAVDASSCEHMTSLIVRGLRRLSNGHAPNWMGAYWTFLRGKCTGKRGRAKCNVRVLPLTLALRSRASPHRPCRRFP